MPHSGDVTPSVAVSAFAVEGGWGEEGLEAETGPSDCAKAEELRGQIAGFELPDRINAYLEALESSPENLALRYDLARLHLDHGLLEEATVQLTQLVRRAPHSVMARKALLECHLWQGRKDQAGETMLELADLYESRGKLRKALDCVHHLLSLDPENLEGRRRLLTLLPDDKPSLVRHHLQGLAELALTHELLEEAEAALERYRHLGGAPGPSMEAKLARALEAQGATERALALYRRVVERYLKEDDKQRAARVLQRILHIQPDSLEERKRAYKLCLELDDRSQAADHVVALSQAEGDVPREAILRRALEICPGHREARRRLVDLLIAEGRTDDVRFEAERLEQQLRQDGEVLAAGDLWRELGESEAAERSWLERSALLYEMAGDARLAGGQWYRLAQSDRARGLPGDACRALARAVRIDPRPELRLELALLRKDTTENPEDSIGEVRNLLREHPDFAPALEAYVDLLLEGGAYEQAAANLQRAGPEHQEQCLDRFRSRIVANQNDWDARMALGQMLLHLDRMEAAVEQLQKTRRHAPLAFRSTHLLGTAFSSPQIGMADMGVQLLRKALEMPAAQEQDTASVRYDLARVLCDLGRFDEAQEELQRFRETESAAGFDLSAIQERLSGHIGFDSEECG